MNDSTVKFEIWDTAGQERFHSLAPMYVFHLLVVSLVLHGSVTFSHRYYRGAHAAVVVFDMTSSESFIRAQNWVKELQRKANPDVVIALAANKSDLAAQRTVTTQVPTGYSLDIRRFTPVLFFVCFVLFLLLFPDFS